MDAFTLEKIDFDAVRKVLGSFCATSLGRARAESISPGTRLPVVRRWLAATEQMVEVVREVGLPPMGGIEDITDALGRAVPGHGASAEDFAQIASTLSGGANVRAFLGELSEHLDQPRRLMRDLPDFADDIAAIRAVVGADGEVRDDASPKLAELRAAIAETTRRIHDIIHGYLRNPEVRKLLQAANVTLHGDRYVLPVRAENRGRLPGVVHRASNTGATVFVEPNASVELNNRLVDLHDHQRQEIDRLLTELAVRIHARREEVDRTLQALTRLDVLSAKAQYAYQRDCVCPEVTDGGPIRLFAAKHPLLVEADLDRRRADPSAGQGVVPIDVRLGEDFEILVITGSNTGGKTVALKTVALLAAMAQAGLHVPARRGATLPIFRDVLIEIGDEQSLEQSLSTFGGHVERLKNIFRKARRDSLVLLDELGSGTDPDEGGAIGQAVLDELRRIGCLAMVTTHFSILKAYALNHDRVDNASVEFDTRTLQPTYHLRIGTPGESHAITVAEKLGLSRRITDRARKHLGRRGSQFRKALRKTGAARQQAEVARADAAQAEARAEDQADKLQQRLEDVKQLREQFVGWLARLQEMQPGEELFVPSVNATGRLVRLEMHRQRAVVDIGSIQREVPLLELMPDLGQEKVRREVDRYRNEAEHHQQQARAVQASAEEQLERAKEIEASQTLRAKQFDTWLGCIARLRVGEEVPIARPPGRGTVKAVDLPGLRATVEIGGSEQTLPLQDLYPQTGPFSPQGAKDRGRRKAKDKPQPDGNRPVEHGSIEGKKARKNRRAVLNTPPGQRVYVIPFRSSATLVRIDQRREQAVVSRGAMEMEVHLADLEPMGWDAE